MAERGRGAGELVVGLAVRGEAAYTVHSQTQVCEGGAQGVLQARTAGHFRPRAGEAQAAERGVPQAAEARGHALPAQVEGGAVAARLAAQHQRGQHGERAAALHRPQLFLRGGVRHHAPAGDAERRLGRAAHKFVKA